MEKYSSPGDQFGYSIEGQVERNNVDKDNKSVEIDFRLLKILKSPTDDLFQILNNNVIGTPGQGMLYQHLRVDNKLNRIADPYFVNLVKGGKIIGTCCFCRRTTTNYTGKIQAFYVRYFSFRDAYRRKT